MLGNRLVDKLYRHRPVYTDRSALSFSQHLIASAQGTHFYRFDLLIKNRQFV